MKARAPRCGEKQKGSVDHVQIEKIKWKSFALTVTSTHYTLSMHRHRERCTCVHPGNMQSRVLARTEKGHISLRIFIPVHCVQMKKIYRVFNVNIRILLHIKPIYRIKQMYRVLYTYPYLRTDRADISCLYVHSRILVKFKQIYRVLFIPVYCVLMEQIFRIFMSIPVYCYRSSRFIVFSYTYPCIACRSSRWSFATFAGRSWWSAMRRTAWTPTSKENSTLGTN